MYILTIIMGLVIILLSYLVWNLSRKNTLYENVIQEFYSSLVVTLHAMRVIDEKQMFESDDEVGEIFQRLADTVSALRPILYGIGENDTKEN
jgi:hypothetical protein